MSNMSCGAKTGLSKSMTM